MGRTWIITKQEMIKTFGTLKFDDYKKKLEKKEKVVGQRSCSKAQAKKSQAKMVKSKCTKSKSKVHSMNEKEEKVNDSWVSNEIKGIELKIFACNTSDVELI